MGSARATAGTTSDTAARQVVPVVARGRRRRRFNGVKLAIGIATLLIVTAVCGAAGWSALRSIGEGNGLSATEEYLAGEGHIERDEVGGFKANFPSDPEARRATIPLFGGRVEVEGLQASLGSDRKVRLTWFDLPNRPREREIEGLLGAIAGQFASEVGVTSDGGVLRTGTELPTYDFTYTIPAVVENDLDAVAVDARLMIVGARVFLVRIEGPDIEVEVLDYFSNSFEVL